MTPVSVSARQTALQFNQNEIQESAVIQPQNESSITDNPQFNGTQALNPELINQNALLVITDIAPEESSPSPVATQSKVNSNLILLVIFSMVLIFKMYQALKKYADKYPPLHE